MFDNPQKELKQLEEQLLKNEMDDDAFERFYREIYEEFGTDREQEAPPCGCAQGKERRL